MAVSVNVKSKGQYGFKVLLFLASALQGVGQRVL